MTDCKHAALAAIDEKAPVVNAVSDGVWDCAELSLQEERSAALYCQVLEQEGGYLESKQIEMSTARQFLFVLRFTKGEKLEQVFQAINLTEKTISEQGFEVRRMDREDLKRVLGLYFGTSMTGEAVEDVDGIKNFNLDRRPDS